MPHLRTSPASPRRAVALDEHGVLGADVFWQRVHGLRAALDAQRARRWALVCDDSAWFAAGLLAVGLAGRTSVVPQAPQAGSLVASGAKVDAVLTDRPGDFPGFATLAVDDIEPVTIRDAQWPDDGARIEFYTSGSSGTPKCAPDSFGRLRLEAECLEREWGALIGDALVLATVPHYHRYGVQMRVIWPLLTGRSFLAHTCLQPADLRRWARRERCVIVSSPAFLARIQDRADLPPAERVAAVFSSGAPLPDTRAEYLAREWGHAAIEIYGSTETAGVASRAWSSAVERPYWRPLNGVQVELREEAAGTRLWVKSPFTEHADWMATGDLARRHTDGRFVLLGRADDVLKIEDKRVSLSEMRTRLAAHPWVEDARLLLLAGARQTIGAVVILNAAGRARLAAEGKLAVNQTLRAWLGESYDAIVTPRKWRFPASLPGNDMGKVSNASLQQLFETRA